MRAIKFSVIAMGVLLVAGMIVVVVTLINRAANLGEEPEPQETVRQTLTLAPGDRIASATLDGSRALLVVDRAAGHQDVLVVDTRSGMVTLNLSGTNEPSQ